MSHSRTKGLIVNVFTVMRGKVPAAFVVGVSADYLLGTLGVFFVVTVAAFWLAARDPRPVHAISGGPWIRRMAPKALEATARLGLIALAAVFGWQLDDPAVLWWSVPLVLLAVALVRDRTLGHWTDSTIALIGFATVVAAATLLRHALPVLPLLTAGRATWTTWSFLLLITGISWMGVTLTARHKGGKSALMGAGVFFSTVGAVAVIAQALDSCGISLPSAWWGANDHEFLEVFTLAGGVGILLIVLGKVSNRPAVTTHCIIPLACGAVGATIAWTSGTGDHVILIVLACVILGTTASWGMDSRRVRAVCATALFAGSGIASIAIWLIGSDPSIVRIPALIVSAGALISILTGVGLKVGRMTDREFAALP